MNNIETIIVSSFSTMATFIAYVEEGSERKFKVKSSDKVFDGKSHYPETILNYVCDFIDSKLISKKKQYSISVKRIKNAIVIFFNEKEIKNSYIDEEDGFFVFPRIILNSVKLVAIKQFYGDKLDRAQYHTKSSSDKWTQDDYFRLSSKDVRLKLYKMILESILIKNYKVSVNCNLYSEVLIDIQTKADYQEEE